MSSRIRSPFSPTSTAAEVMAGRDLSGRVAAVTGGASGIGYETSLALAAAGARVLLAVRDPAAGRIAADAITAQTGNSDVLVGELDLTRTDSVRACAQWIADAAPRLDVLIANAGISMTPDIWTPEGLEQRFATNHLGHALLTGLLMPQLRRAAPARVVLVSSAAHKRSPVVFDDIHYRRRAFDPFEAYGQSKTANILHAIEFTRRFSGDGLTANAVMPGSILTRLQRHISTERMIVNGLLTSDGAPSPNLKTAAQGAATSVWAAFAPELEGVGGLYLENCAEAEPVGPQTAAWEGWAAHARDPAAAERLWGVTEELVGDLRQAQI